MILYLGDSFTWGQGLEFEYLIENDLLRPEETQEFMPHLFDMEKFPLHLQDYREKNRYSRLVSEYFNLGCCVGKYGNGGTNFNSLFILENINKFLTSPNGIELVILQTTHPSRSGYENTVSPHSLFSKETARIKEVIFYLESIWNFKIITLSWIIEMGEYLLNELGEEKVIHFDYNSEIHTSFEPFLDDLSLMTKYPNGVIDGHFSSKGHQFIAKSIIDHIEKYNLIEKNSNFKSIIV